MPFVTDERRRSLLLWTGIKLSKDGKSVFNYNPGTYHAALNFLVAMPFLPGFLKSAHGGQLLLLLGVMHCYWWGFSDATEEGPGRCDMFVNEFSGNLAGLCRFVLALFVSLVLSRTYYTNRGFFGTVFGSSMGLAQLIVSWIRPPLTLSTDPAAKACAKVARDLLIRWINAGFYLMWLEAVPGLSVTYIGNEILKRELLTEEEWDKIENLSSRCTHVYQWMSNVLSDLHDNGYISKGSQLTMMQQEVDKMRAANVWGLPSLPIAYTQMITIMVKLHLFMMAMSHGGMANAIWIVGLKCKQPLLVIHLDVMLNNFLFQGLLDLHGALYNPNSGIFLGHLPALNFMDFVRNVTEHLESENHGLPYKLKLVAPASHTHISSGEQKTVDGDGRNGL